MKLRMLKSSTVAELRANIETNLDCYRTGNFGYIFSDYSRFFDCEIQIDESKFGELIPDNSSTSEVHNCKVMLEVLGTLSPYMARDERLWTYMTHSLLLDYSRERWKIPGDDEKAIKHIATHFFVKDKRGIERDNAASRLWWQATLCSRVKDLALEDALNCLLHESDVRAGIIERPTTSQCINVFCALVKKLHELYLTNRDAIHRDVFRPLMKQLNLHGGIKLLNAMEEAEIMDFINKNIVVPT